MTCERCTGPLSGRQRKFCSRNCKNNYYVQLNRENTKLKAVALLGGKCERCGWDEHVSGLAFHHRNPEEKTFAISDNGNSHSWLQVTQELTKCHLLCHNCHAVVHATKDTRFLV